MSSTNEAGQEGRMERLVGRLRGTAYRVVMKVAHRFNWHYAPPIYPDGDTHLWCKWCGFRQTIRRHGDKDVLTPNAGVKPGRAP